MFKISHYCLKSIPYHILNVWLRVESFEIIILCNDAINAKIA